MPKRRLEDADRTADVLECAVCAEALHGARATTTLLCGHENHTECLVGLERRRIRRPTCPECRAPFRIATAEPDAVDDAVNIESDDGESDDVESDDGEVDDIDADVDEPFEEASERAAIEASFSSPEGPGVNNNRFIRRAYRFGLVDSVERLLADPRVDPSANDNEAIRQASQNGHLAVVERLRADPRVTV